MKRGPRITIISTGSELTAGRSIDTNSAWLANQLFEMGWKVRNFIVLPDDPVTILEELSRLKSIAEKQKEDDHLVIMTGGLGSTEDDYTLECVLKLSGKEKAVNEKARIKLQMLYESRGKSYSDILPTVMRQIYFPEDSKVLDNSVGLAVGFVESISENGYLVCMPGVPLEMKEMFQKKLKPFLKQTFQKETLFQQTRWIWNIGESLFQAEFVEKQKDLLDAGIEWGVTAQKGYIKGIFQSNDESLVVEAAKRMEVFYQERCTHDVFDKVHSTLIENGKTITVAESCTGGLLGSKLTSEPGSSAYFLGGILTYSNEQKIQLLHVGREMIDRFGAVSRETCLAMVDGLANLIDSDYQISITGIAGPGGGSADKPVGTVWIGRKRKGESSEAFKFQFPGNRETVRESASNTALFLLQQIL